MKEVFFSRRDALRRGGFTLIEVVIALAIFLFGALAIIRIFPPGLGVIQNSGDRLTAGNLNRTTLARFDKQPNLIPDAIHDYSDRDNDPTTVLASDPKWKDSSAGAVVGTALRNNSLPKGTVNDLNGGYEQSALGHFKNIVGERQSSSSSGVVLTQYPFETITIFNEDKVTGVRILSDGTLDFSQSKLASNDAVFSTTAIPSAYRYDTSDPLKVGNTVFYVSYRWLEDLTPSTPPPVDLRISGTDDEPMIYQLRKV